MRKTIAAMVALLLAMLGLSVLASSAQATPPGNETKTGLCHRTASDTNPYVFIEVDDESLQSHLTDSKGHFPKEWKTDGTFRGTPHVAGDLKYDYVAEVASDCEDFTPEPTPTPTPTEPTPTPTPTVTEPTPTPTPTPTETEPPCEEDQPCWDCETMGNKKCGPDKPDKPKPPAKPEQPAKPELPHTGAGTTLALGAIALAMISSGVWLYRKFS